MTPLLTVSFAIALIVFVPLLLLALVAATVLLVLLALLALDVLLDRNGVDRRAGLGRGWDRVRRPRPAPDRPAESSATAAGRTPERPRESPAARAPRVPFSARLGRPVRTAGSDAVPVVETAPPESTPVEPTPTPTPMPTPVEPAGPAAIALAESPTPVADAVTEVLAVEPPPAPRTRAARAPRVTPRRPSSPEPAVAPTTDADSAPVDRDSAMDRLFAPLLESDRTEPLPRATPPPRRPRDEA